MVILQVTAGQDMLYKTIAIDTFYSLCQVLHATLSIECFGDLSVVELEAKS